MPYLAAVCASISIHALREEGDFGRGGGKQSMADFYPRPPRGGRLIYCKRLNPDTCISIHALREEGDLRGVLSAPSALHFYPRPPRGGRLHFLRQTSGAVSDFYPRPPRGGRPRLQRSVLAGARFLSTPSARRATRGGNLDRLCVVISIHALREEGDMTTCVPMLVCSYFYPRPPRGGRRGDCGKETTLK